jgi:hypothetical protein
MANSAHFISAGTGRPPVITVRDDRGAPITELELPDTVFEPGQADDELRAAGWSRSADWATADDGWIAPVVPS